MKYKRILDDRLDNIFEHLIWNPHVKFIDNSKSEETENIEYRNGHELIDLKNTQIVMPAEKLYKYQVYAKQLIKKLIEEEIDHALYKKK